MADRKLSELNELAVAPAVDDEVYIRDVSADPADESKRITVANLTATHAAEVTGVHGITDWATYTPTITSGSGTPTTVTATGRWRLIGDTMLIKVSVLITDKGTAAGYMIISLPAGYTQNQGITVVLSAAEVSALGNTGLSFMLNSGTTFVIGTYLGATPWTDTYVWGASGEFKVAYA